MAKGEKRAQMVDGAVRLLATRGLEGTSFAEVLDVTGASRGSTYHHFPGGKDELIEAALEVASQRAFEAIEGTSGQPPQVVMERFVGMWRHLLTVTDQRAGCAVLAVTVATDSDALRQRTGEIFAQWRTRLAGLFIAGRLSARDAESLAALAISATEGAVALARAEHSMEPFELVAERLVALAGS